ncbi:MAG: PIG-L family deacetylase [Saprospiraceae bacterium]|nr:PIG-L family deacetylase [Saprospiraceae bacterium]
MIRTISLLAIIYFPLLSFAQQPAKPTSADIFDAIRKAQVLGSALYVAAHPDDENTRLISFFANHHHYHTTYLSLTRGDGGQNLIGTEIGPLLGLIRTQELLRARATDGGNQLFSRANDFGYSKHPDETFNIWNKDEVLADVVWAIRKTRPDVIVNRFDHRTLGTTHGHHTGSAILSYDAFQMSADASVYPQQLKYVSTWQPTRQFFNTSWFFYGSPEKFEEADKSNMSTVDVGVYYPTKGKSNNEIAAESRSFHKSQGFGATGSRGSENEYLELIQGEPITPEDDPFKGINTTWSRVPSGAEIGRMLAKVEHDFNLEAPGQSIPALIEVYQAISNIPDDGFWIPMKMQEIKQIIASCAGVFVEAKAADYSASPGQQVKVDVEAINRSKAQVKLVSLSINPGTLNAMLDSTLLHNKANEFEYDYTIPETMDFSSPYWLTDGGTVGMYHVPDQKLRGLPESKRPCTMSYTLEIEGLLLEYETPLLYKRNDPVEGEVYRPFEVSPPVFLNFQDETLVFGAQAPRTINVTVKAGASGVKGHVRLEAPEGWETSPDLVAISLPEKGQEQVLNFTIIPPADPQTNPIQAIFVDAADNTLMFSHSATIIEYDHIPTQTVLSRAEVKAVKLDLVKAGDRIGYIMGAGDKVPEFLEQVGYEVTLLAEGDLTASNLSVFDAILVGIRAYNTNERLKFYTDALLQYVEEGGNLIVQYNTSGRRGIDSDDFSPYPLQISRDRVTDEEAEVRILEPDHPVIVGPNKIGKEDFDGWVQERGLYFPDEWDDKFTAILSCNDPGESPKDGALLIAPYGKGWYTYTGLSWFRELPAGVPGAYRLLTNIISLGKRSEP